MHSAFARNLDALAGWRAEVDREVARLGRTLSECELLDDVSAAQVGALRERLASEKVVLAFVAEFSRGKSELINAVFFADAGRRVLPATPGRTTMCPVELRFDADKPPRLSLLPIETRLQGLSLAELRRNDEAWQHVPLMPRDPHALADALAAVTRTQRTSIEQAGALGLWNEAQPEDNPPRGADGRVEIPAWRHAMINYPHPLLERGLVVIDTPGLNAIGAEPELTLGLLPTAHAVVFVLAADTGVTRSDLAVWKDHLGGASLERFVVLNKIDTLVDQLAESDEVAAHIEHQRLITASTLEMPLPRVFPLSARDALAARVARDAPRVAASGVPALESALAGELMPRRQELLVQAAVGVVQQLRQAATRRVADRRRQVAEQLIELRGLRGKSSGKLRMMLQRVEAEATDFERCTARLAALRAVQLRILRGITSRLSGEALRHEFAQLEAAGQGRLLNLGGRAPYTALLQRVRASMQTAQSQSEELRSMLDGTFRQLNADYGFSFAVGPAPRLEPFVKELGLIEESYGRYYSLGQAWRMASPAFAEQFRRMLMSKLRVVYENAATEVELWSKGASTQIELQMRERRRGFVRRREALQRVQSATGDLEQRITEVQQQDEHWLGVLRRVDAQSDAAMAAVRRATTLPHFELNIPAQQDAA